MNGAPHLAPALALVNLRASMVALTPSPAAWDALEAAVIELVSWHMTPLDPDAPAPMHNVPLPGFDG